MAAFMAKKKAEDMREQLRTMITYTRGASAWQELIKMEADIRVKRQKAIYAQKERQRFWIEAAIHTVIASIALVLIVWFVWFMIQLKGY